MRETATATKPKRVTKVNAGWEKISREEAKIRCARNLWGLLKVNHMTVEDLSAETGVKVQRLRKLLNGAVVPYWQEYNGLARYFGYDEYYLLNRHQEEPEPIAVRAEVNRAVRRQYLPAEIQHLQERLDRLNREWTEVNQ